MTTKARLTREGTLALALALCLSARGASAVVELPANGGAGVWEGEAARAAGAWRPVADAMASGGAYMSHAVEGEESVLEFRFAATRPTALRVTPVWWRNSEEKTALRFPKSLPCFTHEYVSPVGYPDRRRLTPAPLHVKEKPGPDRIVAIGDRLWFSAPQWGVLGAVDPVTEKVAGELNVGGYIADLVADGKRGLVFAADAQNDAVVVCEVGAGRLAKRVPVHGTPYSLALAGDRLVAACMEGGRLAVIDASNLQVTQDIALPCHPQAVATVRDTLVVWPRAQAFDPETGDAIPVDRLAWPERPELVWTDPTHVFPLPLKGGRVKLKSEQFSRYDVHFQPSGKLHLSCKKFLPNPAEPDAASAISATVAIPEFGGDEAANVSPVVHYRDLLYFLVPGRKWLYRVDLALPSGADRIDVGDPVSLTVFSGRADGRSYEWRLGTSLKLKTILSGKPGKEEKAAAPPNAPFRCVCPNRGGKPGCSRDPTGCTFLFVADRAGKRVLCVSAATGRIVRQIPLQGAPVHVSVSGDKVYAACTAPDEIVKLDIASGRVLHRFALAARPRSAHVFGLAPTWVSWAGTPPASECPSRLVVQFEPLGFDVVDLRPKPAPEAPFRPPVRSSVKVTVQGKSKEFRCDNMQVICVDNERWIDASSVTDRLDSTALERGDRPGTVAFSMDNGPKHDWMLNRFMTRRRWHLARGTAQFEVANAPVFLVAPGEHVLRVHSSSAWARLDALQVRQVLDGCVRLDLRPEPHDVHGAVPLPSYRGVFAEAEPVRFSALLASDAAENLQLRLSWTALDLERRAAATGARALSLPARGSVRADLDVDLKDTGVFTLRVECAAPDGAAIVRFARFARLPGLGGPSLFYRAADVAAIGERIGQRPLLFERYRKWLRRNIDKPGFLPKAMGGGVGQTYVNMEARWRALGCGLAALFLDPGDPGFYVSRLAPIMKTGHQEAYEHAWEFAGASAVLYDMLAAKHPEIARYRQALADGRHDSSRVADTLMAADEPLSPDERSFLDQQFRAFHNLVHYMQTHAGARGGNWWQGTRTNCGCSLQGVFRNLLHFQGFLGYDLRKFFESRFFSGAFVHAEYAIPHLDRKRIIKRALALRSPGHHGTGGRITAMLASHLTGNPAERAMYDADAWVEKMSGPLPGDEGQAVDELLAETNRFALPMLLALGWYEPGAARLDWDDLPRSILFDVEGEVCMKSDWGPSLTDVYFVSGARDVTYRVEPNHLRIAKAGEILLGTLALQGDHGDPVPSWGNVVLMGADPPERWRAAADWPRMRERMLIDRFPPQVLTYNLRDYALSGVKPANHPYRNIDGIVLHCHSEHRFFPAGRIMAYETWPQFDYAAGDATCAWPIDQAEAVFRQVVYLRPDVIVVYDRGRTGRGQDRTRWIAATAPDLTGKDNRFRVKAGKAVLDGVLLAPENVKLEVRSRLLAFDAPPTPDKRYEYLVVFRTGVGRGRPVEATLVRTGSQTGAQVRLGDGAAEVRFNRTGPVGGHITLGELRNRPFVREVVHSYRHWKGHHLFKKWMQDPGLRQYVVDEDVREFGAADLPDIPAPPRQEHPVEITGLHKGALRCAGFTALAIPGAKCDALDFGESDFLIQARFRLDPKCPLAESKHSYAILMKGAYGSPLFQVGVRGGQYKGVFARGRNKNGKGYLDIIPRTDMAKKMRDGKFHTLAFVRNGEVGRLYVDGVQVAERTNFRALVKNGHPFEIGKACQGSYFEGEIDDVRVWRFDAGLPEGCEGAIRLYEETRDQVPGVLKSAKGVKYSIWRLEDEDGATQARDSGVNGFHLQLRED